MKSTLSAKGAARIARGALARIVDGSGALVSVWDGALWITQEGDARDYYIPAGQSFRIQRDGLTLVHALQRSIVTLGL